MTWRMIEGDCVEAMAAMDEASVDAVVTDPPYNLNFMGRAWDKNLNHGPWAGEALRVLKPGGHLLAFGGTRTYHRLTCALEDAGFEIRDCLVWLYGSGFPKSLDVSKAIDKAAGAEREVLGLKRNVRDGDVSRQPWASKSNSAGADYATRPKTLGVGLDTAPATPDAERWQGWGTALKPSHEPIVLARKPLVGSVAQNVLAHGTGALNIDGTRIEARDVRGPVTGFYNRSLKRRNAQANDRPWMDRVDPDESGAIQPHDAGRWPANVILDEDAAALLDEQSGERRAGGHIASMPIRTTEAATVAFAGGAGADLTPGVNDYSDTGGASRFFKVVGSDEMRFRYTAKADSEERNRGLLERSTHPTVKPVELMQWLCRLVTPPKGTILDPFTGSGSTGIAALREGFSFIGVEREPEYVQIARDRIIGDGPLFNVSAEVTA